MNVRSCASTDCTVPSRPSRALLSSVVIVLSWATPPPLSSRRQRAEHLLDLGVAAGAGERDRRRRRRACSALGVGAAGPSETNFSPSRLVWRISASALAGSFDVVAQRSVTSAVQPSSSTSSTLPTVTSSTLTADCGTRSSTSPNSDGDPGRVVADVGAAGQRQVVDEKSQPVSSSALPAATPPARSTARSGSLIASTPRMPAEGRVDVLDLDRALPTVAAAVAGAGAAGRAPPSWSHSSPSGSTVVDERAQARGRVGLEQREVLAEVGPGVERAGRGL